MQPTVKIELPGMAADLDDPHPRASPVSDLDSFFSDMYYYYQQKGLGQIALTQACNIVTLGFTIVFSVFLVRAFVPVMLTSLASNVFIYIYS